MHETPKVKSDNSFGCYMFVLIIGGVLSGGLGYWLSHEALQGPYPQIVELGLGLFFGLFGIVCLVALFTFNSFSIYTDRVEISSTFGLVRKTVYLRDIVTYTEIEKQNKHARWTDLTIYTDRTKFKIPSNGYNNYFELRAALIAKVPRDKKRERSWHKSNDTMSGIVLMVCSLFAFFAGWHFYVAKDEPIQPSDIVIVSGVITNEVKIDKGSKGSRSIKIKLQPYPDFDFQISGQAYSATYSGDYVAYVKTGDTLYVDILRHEYETKISKEKPIGFWERSINYRFIRVYGLCDAHRCYLYTSDYNRHHQSDSTIGLIFFGFIGVVFLGAGLYLIKVGE
jgi:hypothetical protein